MANVKPIGGTFEDVGEAMAPIKDSVGEAIEQGVQSIVAPQLTPQQQQEKQQQDQKKEMDRQKQLSYTRKWLMDLQRTQEKVRAEAKQKEQQRLQAQEEEKKVSEMKKEEKKKKPVNPAIAYSGKVEIKRGVGG